MINNLLVKTMTERHNTILETVFPTNSYIIEHGASVLKSQTNSLNEEVAGMSGGSERYLQLCGLRPDPTRHGRQGSSVHALGGGLRGGAGTGAGALLRTHPALGLHRTWVLNSLHLRCTGISVLQFALTCRSRTTHSMERCATGPVHSGRFAWSITYATLWMWFRLANPG